MLYFWFSAYRLSAEHTHHPAQHICPVIFHPRKNGAPLRPRAMHLASARIGGSLIAPTMPTHVHLQICKILRICPNLMVMYIYRWFTTMRNEILSELFWIESSVPFHQNENEDSHYNSSVLCISMYFPKLQHISIPTYILNHIDRLRKVC